MKAEPAEAVEGGEASRDARAIPTQRLNKGMSILDMILRVIAIVSTFASALAMGSTKETRPFSTQFFLRAKYNDLPTFSFFVIANSVVCGYLALSLPLSIFQLIRSAAKISRIILLSFDTVMVALLTAGASAAAAIVDLAHKGNANANWFSICRPFNKFCERISGSLIGSFVATVALILIIVTSAVALSRH